MIIHKDSHLDHGLSKSQIAHIQERFADRGAFFIETFELPEQLGTVPCALYGKMMGDHIEDVVWKRRGGRAYESRCLRSNKSRPTRLVTVIAGPHDGQSCVLYTAFGGPKTPKEQHDPTLHENERAESEVFWSEHALAWED